MAVGEQFEILRARPHGHVQAARGAMQRLGFEALLGARACAERDRVCAMVRVGRVLDKYKVGKHFALEIAAAHFAFCRLEDNHNNFEQSVQGESLRPEHVANRSSAASYPGSLSS